MKRQSLNLFLCLLPSLAIAALLGVIFQDRSLASGDGGIYFDCAQNVWSPPLTLHSFYCGSHEFGYTSMALLGLSYIVPGESLAALRVLQLLLYLLAVLTFFGVFRDTFPKTSKIEASLTTLVFSSTPILLAYQVSVATEFVALPFMLLYLFCLYHQRLWLAAFAGLAFAFCKESTLFVYLTTLPFVVYFLLQDSTPLKSNKTLREYVRCAPVLTPLLCYAFILIIQQRSPTAVSKELGLCHRSVFQFLFSSNIFNPDIQSYLFNLFALNFQWMLSIVAGAGAAIALFGPRRKRFSQFNVGVHRPRIFLAIAFLLAWIYTLTRCPLWNNTKYVLNAIPFFLLMTFWLSHYVLVKQSQRIAFFLLVFLLFGISTFRSIDPVSFMFYGKVDMENGAMFCMNSRSERKTSDSCGHDEMFYSLQIFSPWPD